MSLSTTPQLHRTLFQLTADADGGGGGGGGGGGMCGVCMRNVGIAVLILVI